MRYRGAPGTPHRDQGHMRYPPDHKWKRRAENTPLMEQTAVHGGYPPNAQADRAQCPVEMMPEASDTDS